MEGNDRNPNYPRSQEERQDVTPALVARSCIVIFSLIVGASITTNADTVKAKAMDNVQMMDKASTDGSFTIAQTNGQNRRDNRQDCRKDEGAVGADKRNCKQQGRSGG